MDTHYQWRGNDLLLHCQLQPRSSKNEIVGIVEETHINRLKICITAPPVDGKANKHLIAIVAKWLGTAKTRINNLVSFGLFVKRAPSEDGRKLILTPTKIAQKIVNDFDAAAEEVVRTAMQQFSAQQGS